MTDADDEPTDDGKGFEERADFVAEQVLRNGTALGDFFDEVHRSLISKGLALIVGPRGCGKTHMMRYTWLECAENSNLPFCVYVSFNRYLRLEPLLQHRPDALTLFQSWVLGRIILATNEALIRSAGKNRKIKSACDILDINQKKLSQLVAKLERGISLSNEDEEIVERLSIGAVGDVLSESRALVARKRTVLLLDDAALTLTPEYLTEFFDIVRVIKRGDISPKASVYPGSTEYGPRFHATHEGRLISVWLSVEHENYNDVMDSIADRRYPEGSQAPIEVRQLLRYAAFGVPRAYLTLLRDFISGGFATEQQGVNKIIQQHSEARIEEYRTLALKMPRFATLIRTGEALFRSVISELRSENDRLADTSEKQILIGLPAELKPMTARMVNLLIEAGLFYEQGKVSHGPERIYRRFTPHLATLLAERAFAGRSRGGQARQMVEYLARRSAKHPMRRSMGNLVGGGSLDALRLDLPACQHCGTPRLNESQRFCHHCGHKLLDDSTFTRCMSLDIAVVPGITTYQADQMRTRQIQTIGDLMSIQDPGTELRKIPWVGRTRADRIVESVEIYADEFLT